MSKAKKFKQVVSPKGKAFWARLRVEEEYKGKPTGKYSIIVQFSQEDTNKLLKIIEAEYNSLKKTAECFKGARPARGSAPNLGTKEDKEGNTVFKFTTKSTIENKKTGETLKKVVPVFDAKGRPIDVNIGNESVVRIAFSIAPKCVDSKNYGTSLWLDAVKVIDLVEYGGNQDAAAFGFEEEEGFSAEETSFDDEEEAEESEGDEQEEF